MIPGLAALLFTLPLPPNARFAIQHVGTDQGMAAQTVKCLMQDRQGFLWIGTQADGFLRYDGARFERVSLGRGQRNSYAYAAEETNDGRILLVTAGGSGLFDGVHVKRLPGWIPAGACVKPFRVAPDGRVLFGRRDGLFDCDLTGRCRALWPESGAKGAEAQAVEVTRDGTFWFASGPRLFRLRDGAITLVRTLAERVDALVADPSGGFWVRTQEHLYRGDAEGALARDDDGLPKATDSSAVPFVDREGLLWVPTARGLFRKEGGSFRGVTSAQGLAADTVTAVTEDAEGSFWIGLSGNGLERWPGPRSWRAFTAQEGIPSGLVWSFVRDAKKRLFVGTDQGLFLWEGARWRGFEKDSVLGSHAAQLLVLAPDGAVWAQGRTGTRVLRVDGGTLRAEALAAPPGIPVEELRLVRGEGAPVLVMSRTRLFRASAGPRPALTEIDLPPPRDEFIARCIVAKDGTIWLVRASGLLRSEAAGWRVFSNAEGVEAARVNGLASSRHDEVWFYLTTQPGVAFLSAPDGRAPSVRHFTTREGLASDISFGIYADGEGNLWDGGNSGISRVGRDGSVRAFRQVDGLVWDDFNSGAFLAETDGTFLFGTSRGIARYDPSRDGSAALPPPVRLTTTRLGGRDRASGVEVPWSERSCALAFAGLTFRDPTRVRFLYRLRGLGDELVETASRELRFDSLPAGRYRFEVSCRSAAGVASAAPATFAFRILPPWWQTTWFRLAALAAVLAATSGATTLVQRARTRRLLDVERVRTRIATDLHDDLGSSLTEISIVSSVLEKRIAGDPDARELLAHIGETARGLSGALSDCIWSVDPRKDDLGSLVERLRSFARDVFSAGRTSCSFEEPEDSSRVPLSPAERRGVFLLVKEALHNVVKHAGAKEVRVAFAKARHLLQIVVEDDGKGFSPEEISGEGHGLRSMRARAESLGGSCHIEPRPGGGTRMSASIPLAEA